MALTAGHRLGPYEILGALGAGGMGEVYRARDTRLGRTVAVKILPSADLEQQTRFAREARAIASLTHPHICTLYDVGRHDATDYLVMELLDGQTLAARLQQGPLAYGDVLKYGLQIAQALETAHRAGVVHRDLKPSNIMLTAAGAKLLDFGIAKLYPSPVAGLATMTEPTPLTGSGALIGTLQYMAPEQLEGRDADPRSDLFALGAILFEMMTGRRAFEATGPARLIAAIMSSAPPTSELEARAPSGFVDLVMTCLAKNPDERRQTAHDVVLQLQWLARQPAADKEVAGTPPSPHAARRKWAGAALLLATAAAVVAAGVLIGDERVGQPIRVSILPPDNERPLSAFAISPDGTRLVFSAPGHSGVNMLWIRPLASPPPVVVPGTEGASDPFWSPDGRSIGFFAGAKLKVVGPQLGSGAPAVGVLADAPAPRGGTWSSDGTIVFAKNIEDGLYRVAASGGSVTPVTTLDRSRRENSHRWPQFLPDGRRLLFFARGTPDEQGIYVGTPGSRDWKLLLRTSAAARVAALPARTWLARFAGGVEGRLFFTRDETLMVQPFDFEELELRGEPSPLAQPINIQTNTGLFSVSSAALAYRVASDFPSCAWVDRSGRLIAAIDATGDNPRMSPDGKHLAFVKVDHQTGSGDIWMIDVARGIANRLTDEPSYEWRPVWSPDGTQVAYSSNREGPLDLFARAISGTDAERKVLASGNRKTPTHWWRSDGHDVLLYQEEHPTRGWDLMALRTAGDATPRPVLTTRFNEVGAVLSPDGKWVAYASDETGQYRVYVRSFALDAASRALAAGRTWSISADVGSAPQWSGDGRELFYVGREDKLMSVPIKAGPAFEPGAPVPLFNLADGEWFGVAPDGKRFLTVSPDARRTVPVTLFLNWADAVAR